jgi:pimeloyl-ACP methyl ester carboxylesterase
MHHSASFTTSDDVRIHYLTMGDRGSWVVLIHGYTDSARRMWFATGIAQVLAKKHRVVALDNRNHGESDKPVPNGPGLAQDVVELMDHLNIARAHIHGYSMGGVLTGQLLAMIPQRFITAGFGGSGLAETDPVLRAQARAMDQAMPKPQGEDAEAMEQFRARMASLVPAVGPSTAGAAAAQSLDLTKLAIPILAVNGSFDAPHSKTERLRREAKRFESVILVGKTHLTAVAIGAPMTPQYADALSRFIEAFDEP